MKEFKDDGDPDDYAILRIGMITSWNDKNHVGNVMDEKGNIFFTFRRAFQEPDGEYPNPTAGDVVMFMVGPSRRDGEDAAVRCLQQPLSKYPEVAKIIERKYGAGGMKWKGKKMDVKKFVRGRGRDCAPKKREEREGDRNQGKDGFSEFWKGRGEVFLEEVKKGLVGQIEEVRKESNRKIERLKKETDDKLEGALQEYDGDLDQIEEIQEKMGKHQEWMEKETTEKLRELERKRIEDGGGGSERKRRRKKKDISQERKERKKSKKKKKKKDRKKDSKKERKRRRKEKIRKMMEELRKLKEESTSSESSESESDTSSD